MLAEAPEVCALILLQQLFVCINTILLPAYLGEPWYYWPGTPRAVFHMFIQCGNTGTGEDSGCFSTRDPNSSYWEPFLHPF